MHQISQSVKYTVIPLVILNREYNIKPPRDPPPSIILLCRGGGAPPPHSPPAGVVSSSGLCSRHGHRGPLVSCKGLRPTSWADGRFLPGTFGLYSVPRTRDDLISIRVSA